MKTWSPLSRLALIAVVALIAGWLILPHAAEALQIYDKEGWYLTQEAEDRTLAGECAAGKICREYCTLTGPTGFFSCFDS